MIDYMVPTLPTCIKRKKLTAKHNHTDRQQKGEEKPPETERLPTSSRCSNKFSLLLPCKIYNLTIS